MRKFRERCVLRLANGWTVSIAPEPYAVSPHRRCVAAWPTIDDNKERPRFHEFKGGGDRAWSIDDLIEFLKEVSNLTEPK